MKENESVLCLHKGKNESEKCHSYITYNSFTLCRTGAPGLQQRKVWYKSTDVSKYFSTLNMKAISFSEMSDKLFQNTRHQNPEERMFHNHSCDKAKSNTILLLFTLCSGPLPFSQPPQVLALSFPLQYYPPFSPNLRINCMVRDDRRNMKQNAAVRFRITSSWIFSFTMRLFQFTWFSSVSGALLHSRAELRFKEQNKVNCVRFPTIVMVLNKTSSHCKSL